MPRAIVLVIFNLFLSGCGSAPVKPLMEVCIADVPQMEVICGMTTNETWKDITTAQGLTVKTIKEFILTRAMNVYRKPIAHVDRGICLNEFNSNLLIDYTHDLENYIKFQCKPRFQDGKSISDSNWTQ